MFNKCLYWTIKYVICCITLQISSLYMHTSLFIVTVMSVTSEVIAVSALKSVPAALLHTYHGSCMSERPGRQRTGTHSGADAVRVAYADSWPSYNGRRGAARCWFDSLLRGLGQGLLTIQQRQPQGREAFLLTSRKARVCSQRAMQTHMTKYRYSCKFKCCCGHWLIQHNVQAATHRPIETCDNTCISHTVINTML